MQASHVWAKNLGNVGGDAPTSFNPEIIYGTPVANRFNLAANRGNVSQTRRNRLLISAVYDVPVGNNRKFPGHLNNFAEALFEGWSISTGQSLGNGSLSRADDQFELRSGKPESFLSRSLPAP